MATQSNHSETAKPLRNQAGKLSEIGTRVLVQRVIRKGNAQWQSGTVHNYRPAKHWDDVTVLSIKFGEQSFLKLVDDAAKGYWRKMGKAADYIVKIDDGGDTGSSQDNTTPTAQGHEAGNLSAGGTK